MGEKEVRSPLLAFPACLLAQPALLPCIYVSDLHEVESKCITHSLHFQRSIQTRLIMKTHKQVKQSVLLLCPFVSGNFPS